MDAMEKKYTVLYIDDNGDNRSLIERFLKFEGFEVHSVENGQDGVMQAAQVLPDILLIDINLPDISGYEVVDILNSRTETCDIPKVIFSAGDIKRDGLTKFDYFIQKPLDVNTLAAKLQYAIQNPHDNAQSEL
jgi:two-component system cell cycle response regulator DivK